MRGSPGYIVAQTCQQESEQLAAFYSSHLSVLAIEFVQVAR